MATKIADIIEPEVFNPYFINRTTEMARFYMGGIVSNDAQLNALATAGGRTITMPFWNDLTGNDEVLSDSNPLTPGKIDSGTDVARLHMRGRAWGANDLAQALSVGRADPMAAIGDLVAEYWARRMQALLLSSLTGVFADNTANDGADMTAGADNVPFDANLFIDGQATFGDAIGGYSGVAFHPVIYHNLKKIDNISFEKQSEGALEVETYRGLRVIVDRNMPVTSGTYTTYLFGQGAIGFGQGAAPVPSETDRDSLLGEDYLITRQHFILHPRGVAWQEGGVAGESPTNAEVAAAARWDRVYEREQVRIARILSNGALPGA